VQGKWPGLGGTGLGRLGTLTVSSPGPSWAEQQDKGPGLVASREGRCSLHACN
jgi:hypothetical protein